MSNSPQAPGAAGIGLRLQHLAEVAASYPAIAWFEVLSGELPRQPARGGIAAGYRAALPDLGAFGGRFGGQRLWN